jgi:hypothetical protein
MTRLKLALIGAGNRGADVYGQYALKHPDEVEFVALAEPVAARRERFAMAHELEPEAILLLLEAMLGGPKRADAMVITTQDSDHLRPTLAALAAGYDVLLEKPMATTLADCVALVKAAEQAGRILQICHVLRYTNFFRMVRDFVQSGRLGQVAVYEHRENVSYWHMAHSFVRGNWRRKDQSSPMILAKSCHDLDLITWILGEEITRLSSVGTLRHHRARERAASRSARPLHRRRPDRGGMPVFGPRHLPGLPGQAAAGGGDGRAGGFRPGERRHLAEFDAGRWQPGPGRDPPRAGDRPLRPVRVSHRQRRGGQPDRHDADGGRDFGRFLHARPQPRGRPHPAHRWVAATLEGAYMIARQEIRIHDHLTGQTEVYYPAEKAGEFSHADGDRG